MKIINYEEVEGQKVTVDGAKDVVIRWVIDESAGARNFYMRIFDILPGGCTPLHKHDWEHEIFILEGAGVALSDSCESELKAGAAVFVPGGELHQFRNSGDSLLRIMCMIPASGK